MIDWRFSPKQIDVVKNANARINILDGPVRSGKTVAALVRFLRFVREGPPGPLMITGKTERTIRRNVIEPLKDMVGAARVNYVQGSGELRMFGRTIYVVGANDERAEEKIRGTTLAGAYCNELTLHPESAFNQLVARCSIPGARIFADTNPDSPYHWLHANFLANEELIRQGIVSRWQFTLDDNLALDPQYKADLKKLYKGLWYKRMILGLWVMAEGAIYDMWDEEKHGISRAQLPRFERYIVGIDYGTTNPTVFLLIGESRRNGKSHWYVVREYYYDSAKAGRQKTDSEFADDFEEFLAGVYPSAIYHDPSAASLAAEFRSRGIGPLIKADNEVVPGIRLVSTLLGNGELFVCREDCRNLCQEIAGYVWDPKAQLKGRDEPLKLKDHAPDSLRYALYTELKDAPMETGYTDTWG